MSKRCSAPNCKLKSALMVGLCNYCKHDHCLKHRLPEDHQCPQLAELYKKLHEENAVKLMSEKTTDVKVVSF